MSRNEHAPQCSHVGEDDNHLLDEDSFSSTKEDESLLSVSRRSGKTSYEEAIDATGTGVFQYRLLALCGWALCSDSVEILSISFILPPASCDLNLSDTSKGWLNSAVFLGMMVGGYWWGTLADLHGRRTALVWSLTINALGGLASSFAQTYWLFLLLRVVSGVGVGGSMPVIFAYYTEFQSKSRRGAMISFLATFWMCGNILAAALAWIVIPRNLKVETPSFHYNSWRLYLAVCIIPSISSALFFFFMPESPKYLMENDKEREAMKVLQKIYMVNHGRCGGRNRISADFQVGELEVHRSTELPRPVGAGVGHWLKRKLSIFFSRTASLFRPPIRSVMCTMIVIFFTLSYGYYGLFMWFPELFQRMELYGGSPCHPGNLTASKNDTRDPCDIAPAVYLESFLTAISNLPGNIFTILVIERLGRRLLLASSMLLSGLSVFFIWLLENQWQSVLMSCVFSALSVVGWNVLDVLTAELFPTSSRSTATGVLTGIGRIASILGNLTFGALVTTNCAVPMLLVAGLLGGGGLLSIKLPNSANTDLL